MHEGFRLPLHIVLALLCALGCGSSSADIQGAEPHEMVDEREHLPGAIPAAQAELEEVEELLSDNPSPGTLGEGWLGVGLERVPLEDAQALGFDRELIRIDQVFPGTPAASSDFTAGDIVLRLDEIVLVDPADMVDRVRGAPPGTQVTFTLFRDGHEVRQPVRLGIRPELEELVQSIFTDHEAPPLTARAIRDDGELSLQAWAGQVVVLQFWATWCGPCRRSMPALDDLQHRYADRGLVLVGLSHEEPDVIRDFLEKNPVSYTMAYDVNEATTHDYIITAYPTMFLIDRSCTVRQVFIGDSEIPDLEARILELLDGTEP